METRSEPMYSMHERHITYASHIPDDRILRQSNTSALCLKIRRLLMQGGVRLCAHHKINIMHFVANLYAHRYAYRRTNHPIQIRYHVVWPERYHIIKLHLPCETRCCMCGVTCGICNNSIDVRHSGRPVSFV